MKRILLSLLVCVLPIYCNASEDMDAEYSISSLYTGTIGKSNVVMNIVNSNGVISGSYMYDKYKKKILLNGLTNSNALELKEKTNNGTATINLTRTDNGYTGTWCDKKCFPMAMQGGNTFRDGELNVVKIDSSDASSYKIIMGFKNKSKVVTVSDAIDLPSLEFVDINGDGFYDLIARTDHRASNGSQTIYLSSDVGFVENGPLSKENGTLVYDPYKKSIVFSSKDDCCNNFNKVVYFFENGKAVKGDSISFDYLSNKGKDFKGDNISKEEFESY